MKAPTPKLAPRKALDLYRVIHDRLDGRYQWTRRQAQAIVRETLIEASTKPKRGKE